MAVWDVYALMGLDCCCNYFQFFLKASGLLPDIFLSFSRYTLHTRAYLQNNKEQTMAQPMISVNAASCVSGHLLFVNSKVPGRFEKKSVWKQASVIDVYDLSTKAYLLSFHIYDLEGKKIRNFLVSKNRLFALTDTKLIVYDLGEKLKNEINNVSKH